MWLPHLWWTMKIVALLVLACCVAQTKSQDQGSEAISQTTGVGATCTSSLAQKKTMMQKGAESATEQGLPEYPWRKDEEDEVFDYKWTSYFGRCSIIWDETKAEADGWNAGSWGTKLKLWSPRATGFYIHDDRWRSIPVEAKSVEQNGNCCSFLVKVPEYGVDVDDQYKANGAMSAERRAAIEQDEHGGRRASSNFGVNICNASWWLRGQHPSCVLDEVWSPGKNDLLRMVAITAPLHKLLQAARRSFFAGPFQDWCGQ